MNLLWAVLAALSLLGSAFASTPTYPVKREYATHAYYALELRLNTPAGASLDEVSRALGVEVVEQVGGFDDTWLVRRLKGVEMYGRAADAEASDPVLATFHQLQLAANSAFSARSEGGQFARRVVSTVSFLDLQISKQLEKRAPTSAHTYMTNKEAAKTFGLEDPEFPKQWHLVNDAFPEHMMNVTGLWQEGLSGKDVVASFLDDGLDFDTDDLKDAFVPELSYDFNEHVPLPRPTGARDHHGTRCAGQVAARRNKACGVGIAHQAKAAAVRILSGPITTVDEAHALNYGFQNVTLYSCSWGPRDDGMTMEGANYLIRKAVLNGVNEGRDGKGSIFVFASGNGGRWGDQCNFDGYTNSIYSVTVGSVDYKGLHPDYSEACAANMIVAYSSGSGEHIYTTDRWNKCTNHHGGTSAAAPNAVGVFALAMEARPDLTWRDIQHLCVNFARQINPDDKDWEKTATGRMFSYKYGYGVLDGYAFVEGARNWKLVKPQAWLHTTPVQLEEGKMEVLGKKKYKYHGGMEIGKGGIENKIEITQEMLTEHNLETLEHVDVRVWVNHTKRGDVEFEIRSPNGIVSKLAGRRSRDEADDGFPGWRFMTLKHWSENPLGTWTIKVNDQQDPKESGKFLGWNLALWGTAIDPNKVTKFIEPVVDNALPPVEDPDRPVIDNPDLTASTTHPRPTDFLPPDHGTKPGDKTKPAFPGDQDHNAWFDQLSSLLTSQKFFFGALVVVTIAGMGTLLVLWRRKIERQKRLSAYSALPAEDINMDTVPSRTVPRSARGGATGPSDDLPPREPNLQPPTGRALGFHSGFLDDDEPSAGLTPTTPRYRDEPESAVVVPRSQNDEEDGEDDDDEEDEEDSSEEEEDEDEDEDEDDEDDSSQSENPAASREQLVQGLR